MKFWFLKKLSLKKDKIKMIKMKNFNNPYRQIKKVKNIDKEQK